MKLLLLVILSTMAAARATPDKKGSTRCSSDDQCPLELSCMNQSCEDPCSTSPLGDNALCQVCYHQPIHTCAPGYESDDPKKGCVLEVESPTPPMCTTNRECPGDLACIREKCKDPCENKCGANTECKVLSKKPLCTCLAGFTGCALTGCLPIANVAVKPGICTTHDQCPADKSCNTNLECVDPCEGFCGANMLCSVTDHTPNCRCARGFQGDRSTGCQRIPTQVAQCSSNSDCPAHLACARRKCVNPCDSRCGANAQCEVRNHSPDCKCPPGFTGCPLSGCFQEKVPKCTTPVECGDGLTCANGDCVSPCTEAGCGPSTECRISQHTATCVPKVIVTPTPPGRSADIRMDCSMECSGDDHCPPSTACVDHRCVDPCPDRCGENAVCQVANHVPSCVCKPDHQGDPFIKCEPQSGTKCPGGSGTVSDESLSGTKKFWVETLKKADWHEALMSCMKKGFRLATVTTQKDLEDIKKAIVNTGIRGSQFWTAGTDHLYLNEWVWFTTNEPFTDVRDWPENQPDFDGEDCLEFWEYNQQIGYKWNNRNCNNKIYFICEYFE